PVAPSASASAAQSSIASSFLRAAAACWSRHVQESSPGFTHSDWMRPASVPKNFVAAFAKNAWHFSCAASAAGSTASPEATSCCWLLSPCERPSTPSTLPPTSQPSGIGGASLHFSIDAVPPYFRMVALHLSRSLRRFFAHFLQSAARAACAFDAR